MLSEEEKVIINVLKDKHSYDIFNDDFRNDDRVRHLYPKYYENLKWKNYMWITNTYFQKNWYSLHKKIIKVLNSLTYKKRVIKYNMWIHQWDMWEFTRAKKCNSYVLSDWTKTLIYEYPSEFNLS